MAPTRDTSWTLVAHPSELQNTPYVNEAGETRYTMVLGIGGILVAAAALVVAVLQLRKSRAIRKVYEMA